MLVKTNILKKGNFKWKWALMITPLSRSEAQALLGDVLDACHDVRTLASTCLLNSTRRPWLLGLQ